MTREEAIKVIEIIEKRFITLDKEELQALDMAIKALESQPRFLVHSDGKIEQIIEPCDDCVSRQAVLDALDNHKYSNEFCEEHHIDWSINLGMAHIVINELPPVLPKREQGEWIGDKSYPICPKCNCNIIEEYISCSDYAEMYKPMKYCPNCGAEMIIKSCSTCKHDGELVCATHGCHNKERYEVEE